MQGSWQEILLSLLRTLTQILTAGIAITAFSLLIYALTFNLRDRVARSFAAILVCVVIVFSADALGSSSVNLAEKELFLRLQWVGILFLPATYLHFSDGLLELTGKPSRGRRRWAVRLSYFFSLLFLFCLPFPFFLGPMIQNQAPVPFLQPTSLTAVFIFCYLLVMAISWFNFWRAYHRTTNSTSRRRMVYLITGALAPALGSFPFLLFGTGFANLHPLIFWVSAFLSNLLVGVLLVIMAYAVAFFGVTWTDRVVKARLFKWLMRGPITASITLGLVTIVRRAGEAYGISSYSAFVPIVMVGMILLLEHMITLFAPLGERLLFDGSDHNELELLRELEDRLLTHNDLRQFLEMILAAVRDRVQAPGVYIVAVNGDSPEELSRLGEVNPKPEELTNAYQALLNSGARPVLPIKNGKDYLIPLLDESDADRGLVGFLGIVGLEEEADEQDVFQSLAVLVRRATLAVRDWQTQQQVFQTLLDLTPQVDLIQSLRAVSQYNGTKLLQEDLPIGDSDLAQWVKEALTHYWGGPKLTESPLAHLRIVQDAAKNMDGNIANALRSILRDAIDRVKPEGERKYTSEWILYNILEMKFMDGRKVREIALRLAMSEADLYRKQRIAIDMVARTILAMERQARNSGKIG